MAALPDCLCTEGARHDDDLAHGLDFTQHSLRSTTCPPVASPIFDTAEKWNRFHQ
jgi:hypothetical protein